MKIIYSICYFPGFILPVVPIVFPDVCSAHPGDGPEVIDSFLLRSFTTIDSTRSTGFNSKPNGTSYNCDNVGD